MAEDGTMYVADCGNHQIRKLTVQGVVSTLAGSGSAEFLKDGEAAEASFFCPWGLALDVRDGSIIVTDFGNHCIRRVSPQHGVTTLAGTGKHGKNNGPAKEASFRRPMAVAMGPSGHLMVTDANGRLCLISESGHVSTVAIGFTAHVVFWWIVGAMRSWRTPETTRSSFVLCKAQRV